MIAVYLQGGLGNQMFQYAFAAQLAAKHETTVVVDAYWFDHPLSSETPRTLEIAKLRTTGVIADAATSRHWRMMRSRFAGRLPKFIVPRLIIEGGDGVDRTALAAPDGSYLRGFWQSEEYFRAIAPMIASEFAPKGDPSDQDKALLDRMADGRAISLHVRRGDYVSLASAANFHGTCSPAYYRQAIQHITDRYEGCRFFVFSDDPRWAESNLDIPGERYFVAHNTTADAVHDMRLMSHCRHHITANSSFSWWGAWLAEQRQAGGIVVAPRQWFAGRAAPDLVPERWTRL